MLSRMVRIGFLLSVVMFALPTECMSASLMEDMLAEMLCRMKWKWERRERQNALRPNIERTAAERVYSRRAEFFGMGCFLVLGLVGGKLYDALSFPKNMVAVPITFVALGGFLYYLFKCVLLTGCEEIFPELRA